MRKSIISLILAGSFIGAAWADTVELQDQAPDRYVVVKGDTLWDISGHFLKQPWRWPEIWQLNKEEIKNPHWIYPGDVIVLDRNAGVPRLKLLRNEVVGSRTAGGVDKLSPQVRASSLDGQAIASISPAVIDPYLKRPMVLDPETFDKAPRIAAAYDPRLMFGVGDTVYAVNLDAKPGEIWQVFRKDSLQPLLDPDTKQILGHQVQYVGEVRVDAPGEVATLQVLSTKEEMAIGSRLIRSPDKVVINYAPHLPDRPVAGKVISIYGAISGSGAGSYATAVINRGMENGLDVGSVLFAYKKGVKIEKETKKSQEPDRTTPQVKIGNLFIYRVFPKISYGLLLDSSLPLNVGDTAEAEPLVERQ